MKNWSIFWSGGLGDLLVIRPFLLALSKQPATNIWLITTKRSFNKKVFKALNYKVTLKVVENNIGGAIEIFKKVPIWQNYTYWGPHNSFYTKIIGLITGGSKTIFSRSKALYIADAFAEDAVLLGLAKHAIPYGAPPLFIDKNTLTHIPKDYILVHCTAKKDWQTKKWPIEKWKKLLKKICNNGIKIVLIGTQQEKKLLDQIVSSLPKSLFSLYTNLSLTDVELLVAKAKLVICHNSGIMHIAQAYHKKTIILTGSSADYWRPHYPWAINIIGSCQKACNKYKCPLPKSKAKCIKNISVSQVYISCMSHLE